MREHIVTRDEQLAFVHIELERVKAKVSTYILINRIPEDWKGAELRQFLADEMALQSRSNGNEGVIIT